MPKTLLAVLTLTAMLLTTQAAQDPASAHDVSGTGSTFGSTTYATDVASYYGYELAGSPTATGEPFDPMGLTAASLTYPMGTLLEVCLPATGACVVVRVNDSGPYVAGRTIDLSLGAANAIGLTPHGVAPVVVAPL